MAAPQAAQGLRRAAARLCAPPARVRQGFERQGFARIPGLQLVCITADAFLQLACFPSKASAGQLSLVCHVSTQPGVAPKPPLCRRQCIPFPGEVDFICGGPPCQVGGRQSARRGGRCNGPASADRAEAQRSAAAGHLNADLHGLLCRPERSASSVPPAPGHQRQQPARAAGGHLQLPAVSTVALAAVDVWAAAPYCTCSAADAARQSATWQRVACASCSWTRPVDCLLCLLVLPNPPPAPSFLLALRLFPAQQPPAAGVHRLHPLVPPQVRAHGERDGE